MVFTWIIFAQQAQLGGLRLLVAYDALDWRVTVWNLRQLCPMQRQVSFWLSGLCSVYWHRWLLRLRSLNWRGRFKEQLEQLDTNVLKRCQLLFAKSGMTLELSEPSQRLVATTLFDKRLLPPLPAALPPSRHLVPADGTAAAANGQLRSP